MGSNSNTLPLSNDQSMLKLISQLSDEGSLAYNNCIALNLEGELNQDNLIKAVDHVVERHTALRTLISKEEDIQWIEDNHQYEFVTQDFSNLTAENQTKSVETFLEEESRRVFDLSSSIFRCFLITLSDDQSIFGMTIHHITCDGVSVGIILEEIASIYTSLCKGENIDLPPAEQYHQYLHHMDELAKTQSMKDQLDYWTNTLDTDCPELNMPLDYKRPELKTYSGARISTTVPSDVYSELKSLSKSLHATYFMVLEATYSLLLHLLSGQDKLSVGIAFAGRGYPESESVVGYCSNIYPILSTLKEDDSFELYLKRLKMVLLDAYENQDCSFAEIIEKSGKTRDKSRSFFFSVAFNWDRVFIPNFADLSVSHHPQPIAGTEYDMMPNIMEVNDAITISWDYNTDLFEETSIKIFADSFGKLLDDIIKNPKISIADLRNTLNATSEKMGTPVEKREFKNTDQSSHSHNQSITSEHVAQAVREALSTFALNKDINEDDDFFSLGMNSLQLARAFPKIKSQLNVEFSIVDLFKNASIERLSNFLCNNNN